MKTKLALILLAMAVGNFISFMQAGITIREGLLVGGNIVVYCLVGILAVSDK